jgi:Arylsulfotransferase (ASST)
MARIKLSRIPFIAILFACNFPAKGQDLGLIANQAGSYGDGYVLFSPMNNDTTYLLDKAGNFVHTWACSTRPAHTAYLLPDGSLVRTGKRDNPAFSKYSSLGGVIEQYDWNGRKTWSYVLSDSQQTQNHDICVLPNGNIIAVVWEKISKADAIAAGRNPQTLDQELWCAKLVELRKAGSDKADIVWQWRLWDHLVQDLDPAKPNYGNIAAHPELLNLNYTNTRGMMYTDWIHLNAVTYNADLDELMICARNVGEIYIIDHSTTTAEAATRTGGRRRKGGDLLYRWGNPAAYNRGTPGDQKLFCPHNPTWIPPGYPNANGIMIFNNGAGRPEGRYSTIDIIAPPVDANGNYISDSSAAYGPAATSWSYHAPNPEDFASMTMGSAQMMQDGSVLVCDAQKGTFFEIDTQKNISWKYVSPVCAEQHPEGGNRIMRNDCARATFYPASYPAIKQNLQSLKTAGDRTTTAGHKGSSD